VSLASRALVLSLFALASAATKADTVYRSVSPDGKVTYSQRLPADGKIDKTLVFQNLPSTPLPESTLRYRAELMKSMNKKFADAARPYYGQARLFMAQWCGYCKQAKIYLAEKGISYREYDIDTQEGMRAFVEAGETRGVPVILANGQRVQGFSRPAYDALFAKPK
jgi:glutaredoxin